ncbi:hypothetical protein G7046_g2329 [Stylonectria norvegica]|nr:hypothetical protein G7046_g2329 [Stylonectria norvegica]
MRNDLKKGSAPLGVDEFKQTTSLARYQIDRPKAQLWAMRDCKFLIFDDTEIQLNELNDNGKKGPRTQEAPIPSKGCRSQARHRSRIIQMNKGTKPNNSPQPEDRSSTKEEFKCNICSSCPEFPHDRKTKTFRLFKPKDAFPELVDTDSPFAVDICFHYVAVSYCWPKSKENSKGNYTVRDLDGTLRPNRALDDVLDRAVDVATSFGLRMIWIDQECLPQPAEDGSQEEKDEQQLGIQAMDLLYNRAIVTAGLHDVEVSSQTQMNAIRDLAACDSVKGVEAVLGSTENFCLVLGFLNLVSLDDWYTRAWVIQEALSAGRSLNLVFRRGAGISTLSWSSRFRSTHEFKTPKHSLDFISRKLPSEVVCIPLDDFRRIIRAAKQFMQQNTFSTITGALLRFKGKRRQAGEVIAAIENLYPTRMKLKSETFNFRLYGRSSYGARDRVEAVGALSLLKNRECKFGQDIIAIVANMCGYEIRLDTDAVAKHCDSLRVAIIALALLNGDYSLMVPEAYTFWNETSRQPHQGNKDCVPYWLHPFNADVEHVEHVEIRGFNGCRFSKHSIGDKEPEFPAYLWEVNKQVDFNSVKARWENTWTSLKELNVIVHKLEDETYMDFSSRRAATSQHFSEPGISLKTKKELQINGTISEDSSVWQGISSSGVHVTSQLFAQRVEAEPIIQRLLSGIFFDILRFLYTQSETESRAIALANSIWQSIRVDAVHAERDLPDEVGEALFNHPDVVDTPFQTLQLDKTRDGQYLQVWLIDRIMSNGSLWTARYISGPKPSQETPPGLLTTLRESRNVPQMPKMWKKKPTVLQRQLHRQVISSFAVAGLFGNSNIMGEDVDIGENITPGTFANVFQLLEAKSWSAEAEQDHHRLVSVFDVDGPCLVATPYSSDWETLPRPILRSMSGVSTARETAELVYLNIGLKPAVSPGAHRKDLCIHRQGSSTSAPSHWGQDSVASSIPSIGRSLEMTSSPGSSASAVNETGQNARTGRLPQFYAPASSAHKPPTARDIPPVTLTNIAHVDDAEFQPYLTRVGTLYEQIRRVKGSEDEEADSLYSRSSKADESAAVFRVGHLQPRNESLMLGRLSIPTVSSSSPSRMGAPSPIRKSSSGFDRRTNQTSPPLSIIPAVYFDEDFHLENPRTFDVVSERSEVLQPFVAVGKPIAANEDAAAPRKALATNAILQEKLSWYMDAIEIHLIASSSAASKTFFTALDSLRELHSEAADSVEKIKALREGLGALDTEITARGLNTLQKRKQRETLQQLHDAVLQLQYIIDGVARCASFVDNGELEMALDTLDSLERLISGEPDFSKTTSKIDVQDLRLRDLRGATALQSVEDDLNSLRFRIGKVYEMRFSSLLMGDLRRHSETVSKHDVLVRWTNASVRSRGGHLPELSVFPSYMSATDSLRSELLESLTGLHRAKHLTTAVTTYREAALKEIRNVVRRYLPSSDNDDNESMISSSTMTGSRPLSQQQKSSILAHNLRNLEPHDAEQLLINIYVGITETMRRLTTQVKLLLDVASLLDDDSSPFMLGSQMRSPPATPTARRSSIAALQAQEIHQAINLSELLGQAVDVAQDRIVKILRVRSEQSTHLSLISFLRYFTLNRYFASECESISGRSGTNLKTVVNGQIQTFLQQYIDAQKKKLLRGMESDKWDAKDFSKEAEAKLNGILSCTTTDPPEWLDSLKIWIPYSDDPESTRADDSQPKVVGKAKTRNASIDKEKFVLPESAILCLQGLSHFLQLMVGIPSMIFDIGASLISYLRLFNSCCSQLILDAGARQSAGLKNITSKHLLLASQALAFIATLISCIREFVRRHGGDGAAVSILVEFDKVKRLYLEHQNSIYDKIVDIMSRLAASHVKAMKDIDWDDEPNKVHPYMATLSKDTISLHRILTKTLPESTFGKAFEELGRNSVGTGTMLQDVEFFESQLGVMSGCGDIGEYLVTIIKSNQVKSIALAAAEQDK